MKIIDGLKWRYATKYFNKEKKVSKEDISILKEAVNLTASSYGLQPYKVIVISDSKIRESLKEASWGQSQITDASHLFLFCNNLNVTDVDIDNYIQLRAKINNLNPEDSKEYADMMKSNIGSLPPEILSAWTARQCYIALGTLLAASSEMEIDSCPMEGFDNNKYDEILGLKEKGLSSAVLCAIGYRDDKDSFASLKKVRKSISDVFDEI